ncbi:hypothetical protein PERMA_A0054 (plasmid) [Persephonella marina EX-H1]|uniref:Uncharacterized protein n=1 Tax=Persephonella marina (strain DSM 14350 / EX-H1) TaxID=123214 RepID=C0QUY3_PERMH|nr:hypothetical protein PERMA_A0054 [Persephonella marina EX-H1]
MWKYVVLMILSILVFFYLIFLAVENFKEDLNIRQERFEQLEKIFDN